MAPLSMYEEKNTRTNLPAQIEIYAGEGDEYHFLFITKGGGSANKSYLYQETRAILNPGTLADFIENKMKTLGTAACPPYHLVVVIGGTSAEMTLKTVKLASCRYLDRLPDDGERPGPRVPRSRARKRDPRSVAKARHRRPVRRHVLLPRRAGHSTSAARSVASGRDRRLLLRRPAGARKDHARRCLSREARDEPRRASFPRSRRRISRPRSFPST